MGTTELYCFSDLVIPNEVFYGLFFVYRFGMLETRSIGGGYCHAGDDWRPPGSLEDTGGAASG